MADDTLAPVWLIGSGGMAVAYADVLRHLEQPVTVIGRGAVSARSFNERTGLPVSTGGLAAFLATGPARPTAAIVAVGVEALEESVRTLLAYGVTRILVEKPGGLNRAGISELAELARERGTEVQVAYNRRFYASTLYARALIAEDGGVQSMHFEFTEWGHQIRPLPKAPGVKDAWFLANSTHVVDLAFHLGGTPTELVPLTAGGSDWHPAASIFAGAGRTDSGALFSYQANWEAPGRWGVELITARRRLILRPLEQLHVMAIGSVKVEQVPIDDRLDVAFKPGLVEQTRRFLTGDRKDVCTIHDQLAMWPMYEQMAGYLPGAPLHTVSQQSASS